MPPSPRRVRLQQLAAAVAGTVNGDAGVEVNEVVIDTRGTVPGSLYCCVRGSRVDGHDLACEAVAAGAVALLAERPLGVGVPELIVPDVRAALGPVAAAFWGRPSERLQLVGVTGTNGKTTSAFMLDAIFRAAGLMSGLVGTVEVRVGEERRGVVHTTPEAPDLQRLLAEMTERGVQAAAMEVSSHGLVLGRVTGTRFRVALFTNLTQDHLDFHADLEDYFRAKARLFEPDLSDIAVVNVDDPFGRRLAHSAGVPVVTTAVARAAEWRAHDVEAGPDGTGFVLEGPGVRLPVRLQLAGEFNVANALGAVAAAAQLGIDPATSVAGVAGLPGVPGRFERVDAGQAFTVLVDYAHTPDSLERSLRAARSLTAGRVLVVFGCGGDRDRGKRPLMGEIAGRLADTVVVTSDNPRSERPDAIVAEVVEGVRRSAPAGAWSAEVDRRAAIRKALASAHPGDVVVVAGKGHEQGQELAGRRKIPFDDRVVVREELSAR